MDDFESSNDLNVNEVLIPTAAGRRNHHVAAITHSVLNHVSAEKQQARFSRSTQFLSRNYNGEMAVLTSAWEIADVPVSEDKGDITHTLSSLPDPKPIRTQDVSNDYNSDFKNVRDRDVGSKHADDDDEKGYSGRGDYK